MAVCAFMSAYRCTLIHQKRAIMSINVKVISSVNESYVFTDDVHGGAKILFI